MRTKPMAIVAMTLTLVSVCGQSVEAPGGLFNFFGPGVREGLELPYISGAELWIEWKAIEPERGVFKWEVVDDAMKPWKDAGKRVAFRLASAGNRANSAPMWLFKDLGAKHVDAADFTTNDIMQPVYWDEIVVKEYTAFMEAFAKRYDGDPAVEFVDIGNVGRWEETYVYSENEAMSRKWQEYGYTHERYIRHVKRMVDIHKGIFKKTPLALLVSVGGPDPDPAKISRRNNGYELTDYAVKQGMWLKQGGMGPYYSYSDHEHLSRLFSRYRGKTIRIYEQVAGFTRRASQSGNAPPQTRHWTMNMGFSGSPSEWKNYLNRALLDCPDYLWLNNRDIGNKEFQATTAWAATQLRQKSYRDGGPLYIRFQEYTRPSLVDPARQELIHDEWRGLVNNWQFPEMGTFGHAPPWNPSIPFKKDQGPWAYPKPEAADVAGVHCRITKPAHPFVYLDLEDVVTIQESGTQSEDVGEIPAGWMRITFHDSGTSNILVDYNWDGKDSYKGRATAKMTGTGKWRSVELKMSNLRFLLGREMPEPDFRIHAEDGKLAIEKIELRFWQ